MMIMIIIQLSSLLMMSMICAPVLLHTEAFTLFFSDFRGTAAASDHVFRPLPNFYHMTKAKSSQNKPFYYSIIYTMRKV